METCFNESLMQLSGLEFYTKQIDKILKNVKESLLTFMYQDKTLDKVVSDFQILLGELCVYEIGESCPISSKKKDCLEKIEALRYAKDHILTMQRYDFYYWANISNIAKTTINKLQFISNFINKNFEKEGNYEVDLNDIMNLFQLQFTRDKQAVVKVFGSINETSYDKSHVKIINKFINDCLVFLDQNIFYLTKIALGSDVNIGQETYFDNLIELITQVIHNKLLDNLLVSGLSDKKQQQFLCIVPHILDDNESYNNFMDITLNKGISDESFFEREINPQELKTIPLEKEKLDYDIMYFFKKSNSEVIDIKTDNNLKKHFIFLPNVFCASCKLEVAEVLIARNRLKLSEKYHELVYVELHPNLYKKLEYYKKSIDCLSKEEKLLKENQQSFFNQKNDIFKNVQCIAKFKKRIESGLFLISSVIGYKNFIIQYPDYAEIDVKGFVFALHSSDMNNSILIKNERLSLDYLIYLSLIKSNAMNNFSKNQLWKDYFDEHLSILTATVNSVWGRFIKYCEYQKLIDFLIKNVINQDVQYVKNNLQSIMGQIFEFNNWLDVPILNDEGWDRADVVKNNTEEGACLPILKDL